MKVRCPTLLRIPYYRWRQRAFSIRPWIEFAGDCLPEGGSVAIVGNAGYLAELRQAERIDGHDVVIRMNNFRTDEFYAQVGRRTDLFFCNFFTNIEYLNPAIRDARWIVSSRPNRFWKDKPRKIIHRFGEQLTRGMQALDRHRVYVPEYDYFLRLTEQIGRYPTTGLAAVLFALDFMRSAAPVYITGFSFFEGRSHYFSRQQAEASLDHNVEAEKQILRNRLHEHLQTGRVTVDPIMGEHLSATRGRAA